MPTEALVGQSVAVMPITLIAADPALQSDTIYAPYRDRQTTLLWADSLIGEAFTGRAPEVRWVLPPELRKIARRSPGIVGDPDQMGQAMLRSPKLNGHSRSAALLAAEPDGGGGRAGRYGAGVARVRPAGGRADPRRSLAGRRGYPERKGALALAGQRQRRRRLQTALDAALTAALPLDTGGP